MILRGDAGSREAFFFIKPNPTLLQLHMTPVHCIVMLVDVRLVIIIIIVEWLPIGPGLSGV